MKRNLLFLVAVTLVLSTLHMACKKDDDDKNGNDKTKKNLMTYDGKEYDLAFGFIENWGDYFNSGAYNFDITLFSSGITYDTATDQTSGTGHIIYFELMSSSETQLVPGTYTFTNTGDYKANTFEDAGFAINFNITTLTGEIERDITGGTLKVAKTGNVYEFTIDAIAEDSKPVTGYYKGVMFYFDETKKKSQSGKPFIRSNQEGL